MRALVLILIAGCHEPATPAPAPAPRSIDAPKPIDAAPAPAPKPIDAARHAAGSLKQPKKLDKVWPWRVCVDGDGLVFENDCGCNDALLCTFDHADASTVAYTLETDPNRMPECTDCFPMVPARCALPSAAAPRTIVINGEPAIELPADAHDGDCWEAKR